MSDRPDTLAELCQLEDSILCWDERGGGRAVGVLQNRDRAVMGGLGRYHFLTSGQIAELWWPQAGMRAVRRRLSLLFEGGYVERFRPWSIHGKHQWIYCLAGRGHQVAQRCGELPDHLPFAPRRERLVDHRYVLHDLRLNEWVLAYRRAAPGCVREWEGAEEARLEAPAPEARGQLPLEHRALGMKQCRSRGDVVPDAALELVDGDATIHLLIEYDRTRRVDKNFDKFRRYDALICSWWRDTRHGRRGYPPYVLFVCQDADHRARFLEAADKELQGRVLREEGGLECAWYGGREHLLVADEQDMHSGRLRAWELPAAPAGTPGRADGEGPRAVMLPGAGAEAPTAY